MSFITRIAPSPTGMFHLGTARTAYVNYLAARSSNGRFILRIDDTDIDRNKNEYTQIIIDSLDWLSLEPDEIYYQSKRTGVYTDIAEDLVNHKLAKELDNGAVALLWPKNMPASFEDSISGTIPITETNKTQIHEKTILLRGGDKLGQPTYQFCSALDDWLMCVNWIIRGTDHISNTPKQIAIRQAVELIDPCKYNLPKFTHMGLIKYEGKKLSKRDNAASLLWYKEQGYSPAAMLNFLLRLGWSPKGDNKEHKFIDKQRAIKLFANGNLSNKPCTYELHKLEAYRKHYG